MRRVIGIGETIVDIIFTNNEVCAAKPGGSAFNSLISLGRMQANAYLISEFGNDNAGNMVESFMKENNVSSQYVRRFEQSKTPISLAFLQESGDAEYSFYKEYPKLRLQNIEIQFTPEDIVIFGAYYSLNPALRSKIIDFITQAKQAGAIILYDPNFRSSHNHERVELQPAIKWNMEMADITRASDEDFQNIFELNSVSEQFEALKPLCPNLIITENKDGIHFFNSKFNLFVESDKITPVSTIGAGDSFNAGVVFSLLKQNIYKKDLENLNPKQWEMLLNSGKMFSTNCCLSMDNYISF